MDKKPKGSRPSRNCKVYIAREVKIRCSRTPWGACPFFNNARADGEVEKCAEIWSRERRLGPDAGPFLATLSVFPQLSVCDCFVVPCPVVLARPCHPQPLSFSHCIILVCFLCFSCALPCFPSVFSVKVCFLCFLLAPVALVLRAFYIVNLLLVPLNSLTHSYYPNIK